MASSVQPNDSGTVEQSASEITQSSAKYTAALYDQARMTSASVMDAAIGTGATAGSTAVCGVTSLGEIVVWALSNSLAPIDSSTTAAASVSPARRVQAHAGSAYCCCTVNTDAGSVLVTGGDEETCVWRWPELVDTSSSSPPKAALTLKPVPVKSYRGACDEAPETNGIACDAKSLTAFTACGDNNAYAWDLASGKCVRSFEGHTEYLHGVHWLPTAHALATASEDGTVRLWDTRAAKCTATLKPPCSAGDSKWLGAIAADDSDNWLACGGGSGSVHIYHIASGERTASVDCGAPVHALRFTGAKVAIGSESSAVQYLNYATGKLGASVHVTSPMVYSIRPVGSEAAIVSGASPFVDIIVNACSVSLSLSATPALA